MEFNLLESNGQKTAEIKSDQIILTNIQDALDLMGNADYQGARSIVIYEKNIVPEFFDLKTRLAGEILQKYANYNFSLAVIGEFEKYKSSSLNAFIVECNRGKNVFFVQDLDSALEKISKQ